VLAAGRRGRSVERVAALSGVVLALVALGLVGHTRAFPPLWLMLVTDLVHVAAGAVWFGGLVGLVLSLRRLGDRPRTAALVLGRFSALAAFLLAGVAISGSVLGWRVLRSWDNLVSSDFGRLLLAKIAVVLAIVAVAAYNRFRLLPGVLADAGHAERGTAAQRMQRVVRAEALLLVGVLGLTGFLVDRSPVESPGAIALPGGFDDSTFSGQAQEVRVVASLAPLGVGRNEVRFQVQDLAGNPIEPAAAPVLTASAGSLALGDQEVRNVDSGTYRATLVIPRPGTWTLQVSVRLTVFDNPVVSITVPVPASR
jgi:copper transport protein